MWLFTKEAAIGIVRTIMPFIYGWLVGLIPGIVDWAETIGVTQEGLTLVLGGVIYTLIRQLAERWPFVGRLLIFNTKPDYSAAPGVN